MDSPSLDFLNSSLWYTIMGINLIAQLATSIFLYKYQSTQLSALGQIVILIAYGFAIYNFGLPALLACIAMYVVFLLFCNRIVFYLLKN